MLGLPDQDLSFSITEDNLVSVAFPSMSRLRSSCGPGCDWAYVLRISGLKTPSTTSTTSPAVTSGQPMTNGAHQLRQLPPLLVAAVSMAMLSKGRAEM